MNNNYQKISFLLVVFLISLLTIQIVLADNYVVANTKDWKSLYEISVYAGFKNESFVFLKDLGDAEIKTKLMSKNDNIVVFESMSNPVVKNYDSFLRINGYTLVGKYSFNDVYDLQEYLHDQVKPKGDYLFSDDFGIEPLVITPYLLKNDLFPLFYSQDSMRFLKKINRREPIVAVGRIPVRPLSSLTNLKMLFGNPKDVSEKLTVKTFENIPSEWGILTRIDAIDLTTLKEQKPLFVYFSEAYLDDLTSLVKKSEIKNYEVIGGDMADISKTIEAKSGKNLNLMLKFGRKITNLPGYEDKVLNVDVVSFPYPFEEIIVKSIKYDSGLGKLLLTLENKGNIDVYSFSNIDFSGLVVSDLEPHLIRSGETRTIPYSMNITKLEENATLTVKYGYSFPLKNSLSTFGDAPIVREKVSPVNNKENNPSLIIKEAFLDTKRGVLIVHLEKKSPKDIKLRGELIIGENHYLSDLKKISSDKDDLLFELPFVSNKDILGKNVKLSVYYGENDLLFTKDKNLLIKEQTGDKYLIILTVTLIILVLLLALFFILFKRRSGKDD